MTTSVPSFRQLRLQDDFFIRTKELKTHSSLMKLHCVSMQAATFAFTFIGGTEWISIVDSK